MTTTLPLGATATYDGPSVELIAPCWSCRQAIFPLGRIRTVVKPPNPPPTGPVTYALPAASTAIDVAVSGSPGPGSSRRIQPRSPAEP